PECAAPHARLVRTVKRPTPTGQEGKWKTASDWWNAFRDASRECFGTLGPALRRARAPTGAKLRHALVGGQGEEVDVVVIERDLDEQLLGLLEQSFVEGLAQALADGGELLV